MSLLSSLSSNPRGLIGFIFGLFVRHMGNPFSGILLAIEFVGSLRCELILCESPKLFFVVRSDILPVVNDGASRTAVGYLPVYDTTCSLVLNAPLSRSNKYVEGCATQPLLLSSP